MARITASSLWLPGFDPDELELLDPSPAADLFADSPAPEAASAATTQAAGVPIGIIIPSTDAYHIRSFGGERLTVAAMARIAGGLLSQAVVKFKQAHPQSLVTLHSGAATTINSWVSAGLCDMGLAILYGADPPGMQVETLLRMDCVALLPRGHRLARQNGVQAADFEGEDFISFPQGSDPRERIDRVWASEAVRPRTVLESDLGASVCALVAAGLGVSLLTPLAAHEEQPRHAFVIKPFSPPVTMRLAIQLAPQAPNSRMLAVFRQTVLEVIETELRPLLRQHPPRRYPSPGPAPQTSLRRPTSLERPATVSVIAMGLPWDCQVCP